MIFLHVTCFFFVPQQQVTFGITLSARKRVEESVWIFSNLVCASTEGSDKHRNTSSPPGNTGADPGTQIKVRRRHSPVLGAIEVF